MEKKTTVVIEAIPKGFEQTAKAAKAANAALDPSAAVQGFKHLSFFSDQITRQMRGLNSGMREFTRELRGTRDVEVFKSMASDISKMTDALNKMTEAKKKSHEEDEKHAKHQSFVTGVMHGAEIAQYVPENFRAAQYAAGRGLGGAARAPFAAFGGGMFHGAEGFAEGLRGIPFVGGFAAGQMQSGMAAAQDAMQFEQVKKSLVQFGYRPSGGGGGGGVGGAAGGAVTAGAASGSSAAEAAPTSLMSKAFNLVKSSLVPFTAAAEVIGGKITDAIDEASVNARVLDEEQHQVNRGLREGNLKSASSALGMQAPWAQWSPMASNAGAPAPMGPLGYLRGAGESFGMDQGEAAQLAGQALQMSGGGLGQFNGERSRALMGLNTMGVGPDVMGAFMRGGRNGAIAGGRSDLDAMGSRVTTSQGLGLEGADFQNAMRMMASSLMDAAQNGFSINDESINEMARQIATEGVNANRSLAITQGLQTAGQGIAQGGPKNAAQFLMARTMFGYQGGGTDDLMKMMQKAESGQFSGGVNDLTKSIRGSQMKDSAKALAVMQLFGQLGIRISTSEATKFARGEADPGAEKKLRESFGGALGLGGLLTQAEEAVPGATKDAAVTKNIRQGYGAQLLPALDAFERSVANVTGGAAAFSKEINEAGEKIKSASESVPKIMKNIEQTLDHIMTRLGS